MRQLWNVLCVWMLAVLLLVIPAGTAISADGQASSPKAASVTAVNLNTASAELLDTLPGIGPKTAALIIAYRQKNGGFRRVEDLMNVRGIGEKSFIKLRPFVTVTPVKAGRASSGK